MEKEEITAEIIEVVDKYIEAVTSNDLEKTLAFWSDSDEFIHAGDGSIIGGYAEWSSWLRDWTASEFRHVSGEEVLPPNIPEPRGMGFMIRTKVDADHAGD